MHSYNQLGAHTTIKQMFYVFSLFYGYCSLSTLYCLSPHQKPANIKQGFLEAKSKRRPKKLVSHHEQIHKRPSQLLWFQSQSQLCLARHRPNTLAHLQFQRSKQASLMMFMMTYLTLYHHGFLQLPAKSQFLQSVQMWASPLLYQNVQTITMKISIPGSHLICRAKPAL